MSVVLLAGGIAVMAQRQRSEPQPSSAAAPIVPPAPSAPVAVAPAGIAGAAARQDQVPQTAAIAAPADVPSSADTWVVQVGTFSSHARSLALVQSLTQSGFQAFEVPTETSSGGLVYFVRVGPFKTANEADEARATLRESEFEDAFVRSVTTQ
jgi:cell division septation protein DedD